MDPYRLIVLGASNADVQQLSERVIGAGHTVVAQTHSVEQLFDLVRNLSPDTVIAIVDDAKCNFVRISEICKSNGTALVGAINNSSLSLLSELTILNANALFLLDSPIEAAEIALFSGRVVYNELAKLNSDNAELRETIETRKIVERAKGILMDRHKLSESDAFKRIHFQARNQNKKMKEIAESIITASELM